MKKIALGILMTVVSTTYAEIYKWTDSQGVIHFGDTPHEGSETIKLPQNQIFSAPSPQKETPVAKTEKEDIGKNSNQEYSKLIISEPQDQATVRNNQGSVIVTVVLEPALQNGDKIQLLFDRAPLGEPQLNSSFELNGIYRGTHTIAAQVINAKDEVVKTSDPITIYMQRPRLGMVPGSPKPQ